MTASRAAMFALVVLVSLQACRAMREVGPDRLPLAPREPGYDWQLPPGFPEPWVPADNPMSAAKVELGRRLFYDTRLSGNQTYSCASCHHQELAFTDGRARAVGSTGETHQRSAMSLVNVAYNTSFNWGDLNRTSLEDQILVPMFNRDPVELGLADREEEVEERLREDADIAQRFERAFPQAAQPVTLTSARSAIASFVRTILSADSPYDRYVFWGERDAVASAARRGMELFFSDRTHCSECHRAPLFTGGLNAAESDFDREQRFHNTGLYDLDGEGTYPEDSQGLIESTAEASDMGRFKAPTLRNVELTAPYMHDGSVGTLEEVIDFYAAGGRGSGQDNPYKDPLITGFDISTSEKTDLIAFLKALTDRSVLQDPRFGPPRAPGVSVRATADAAAGWLSASFHKYGHVCC